MAFAVRLRQLKNVYHSNSLKATWTLSVRENVCLARAMVSNSIRIISAIWCALAHVLLMILYFETYSRVIYMCSINNTLMIKMLYLLKLD